MLHSVIWVASEITFLLQLVPKTSELPVYTHLNWASGSSCMGFSHLQSDLEEPETSAFEIVFILLYLTKGCVSATSDHS